MQGHPACPCSSAQDNQTEACCSRALSLSQAAAGADVSVVLDGQLVSASASRCQGGMQAVCEAAPHVLPDLQAQLDVLPSAVSLPHGLGASPEELLARHVQLDRRRRTQRAAAHACVRVCEDVPQSPAASTGAQVSRLCRRREILCCVGSTEARGGQSCLCTELLPHTNASHMLSLQEHLQVSQPLLIMASHLPSQTS